MCFGGDVNGGRKGAGLVAGAGGRGREGRELGAHSVLSFFCSKEESGLSNETNPSLSSILPYQITLNHTKFSWESSGIFGTYINIPSLIRLKFITYIEEYINFSVTISIDMTNTIGIYCQM